MLTRWLSTVRLLTNRWLAISRRRLASRREQGHLAFTPAQRIHADVGAAPRPALAAGHEDLDRVNDRVDVAEPWPVIRSGQLDVAWPTGMCSAR